MTRILVDTDELSATVELLRSIATEASELGAGLWACAQCPMPAELQPSVDQAVAFVDRALDLSALTLLLRAVDLAHRGILAATDVVAAATTPYVLAPAAGVGAASLLGGMSIVGGSGAASFDVTPGYVPGPMIIGGGGSWGTIEGGYSSGPMIIGGGSALGTVSSGSFGSGSMILGGPGRRDDNPAMVLARLVEDKQSSIRAQIAAINNNPNSSPLARTVAMNAGFAMHASNSHVLAPSRRELEATRGPLTDSEVRAISPHTLAPPPANLFEGVPLFG